MSKTKQKNSPRHKDRRPSSRPAPARPAPARPAPRSQAIIWLSLALLAAIILGGVWVFTRNSAAPSVQAKTLPPEISIDEAAIKRSAGAFILDVRQPEEWVDSHIPGATLIPLGELESRLAEVPRDQEVVVVCRSGNRSQAGRDILMDGGFQQVTSMSGGLNQWKAAGYETVSGP